MKYLLICSFLALCCQSRALKCRWMDQKFKETNAISLGLLQTMGGHFIEADEKDVSAFPDDLYTRAANATAEDRAWFILQVLKEITQLFDEDLNSASWEENELEHFLSVLDKQIEGVNSCIVTKKKIIKKLHMYFQRLSHHILKKMKYSANAWELIRMEVKRHLNRLDII